MLDSSFLERMNTLLANGEVPGLFEGDEFTTLMTQCKEGAVREGLMLDSQEELYKWFTEQVSSLFVPRLLMLKGFVDIKKSPIIHKLDRIDPTHRPHGKKNYKTGDRVLA